ncbi:MAG: hypothetical protein NC218_07020 [Acetobacter sp.]|nr:hypothetical protein [Acetobacter sp.]
MKLKNWFAALSLTMFPKPAAAEHHPAEQDSTQHSPIELRADTLANQHMISPIDTIPSDSTLYEMRLQLLRESKKDMLLLIAHFEDVKARAYWDNIAKIYSVGYGFTRKPDGTKVTRNTIIHSEEELMQYWEHYAENNMFPTMAKYLKIENTDHQERISLASTAFNCGAGIYKEKKAQAPSKYAETLNNFFETRDTVYLNKALYLLKQRNTSKGRTIDALTKRRRVEADILSHKIILVNSDTVRASLDSTNIRNDSIFLPENSLDLNKTIIGAAYSIGNLPADSAELATRIREYDKGGYNYADSVKRAFSAPPIIPVKRRSRKTTAKPRSGGR